MIGSLEAALGLYGATLAIGVLSGVIPVVNAELYLVGAVLVFDSLPAAIILGLLVAVGQMIAKLGIYQAARGASQLTGGKARARLERARALIEKWRDRPLSLIAISASTGLPPFYIVSLLAGMLQVRFVMFLVVGLIGRALRFVTIAVIAASV